MTRRLDLEEAGGPKGKNASARASIEEPCRCEPRRGCRRYEVSQETLLVVSLERDWRRKESSMRADSKRHESRKRFVSSGSAGAPVLDTEGRKTHPWLLEASAVSKEAQLGMREARSKKDRASSKRETRSRHGARRANVPWGAVEGRLERALSPKRNLRARTSLDEHRES